MSQQLSPQEREQATSGLEVDDMADSQRKTANLCDVSDISETVTVFYKDKFLMQSISEGTYTLSFNTTADVSHMVSVGVGTTVYSKDIKTISGVQNGYYTIDFTISAEYSGENLYVRFVRFGAVTTVTYTVTNIMLNSGSTALPYEPYGWVHSLRKLGTSTDAITTLPADLYADGQSATVGLQGNMEQTGTPTPQNPIQPQECGDMTGNLFDVSDFTYTTGSGSQNWSLWSGTLPSGTYTVSIVQESTLTSSMRNTLVVSINGTSTYESPTTNYHNDAGIHLLTFTVEEGDTVNINYWMHTLSDNCTFKNAMLNTGSTALPYKPYGIEIPISSANTTTPVYLGEVQSTRRIKQLVLDGTENISINAKSDDYEIVQVVVPISDSGTTTASNVISSHFVTKGSASQTSTGEGVAMRTTGAAIMIGISFSTTGISTSDSFAQAKTKVASYLSTQYANGTPVCVWYVLTEPTTGIVNEPIRKIGDYADTVSGITIPTITGKDSFDVLTTLKPSEVSLAYTGWHDASVKEWDGSEWQDEQPVSLLSASSRPTLTESTPDIMDITEPEEEKE